MQFENYGDATALRGGVSRLLLRPFAVFLSIAEGVANSLKFVACVRGTASGAFGEN